MKIVINLLGFLVIVGLSGCSSVGMLSKTERFNGRESFEISTPRVDILDVIASAGKDMGLNVGGIDKVSNNITLSNHSSTAAMFVGSMNYGSITASIKNSGKIIDVAYSTSGNFGNGGKEASTKLMEEFKAKLESRLGEKLVDKGEFNSQSLSKVVGNPAPQSKFANLKVGMSINQVKSLIGESKDCGFNHKAMAEFSIAGYDCPYKGEGLLIFDWSRQSLFRVVVDTTMGDYRPVQN